MKAPCLTSLYLLGVVISCSLVHPARSQSLLPVSVVPSVRAPAGGGGDSFSPILNGDGNLVLFASTAGNLTAPGTVPGLSPAVLSLPLQVYERNRTNGVTRLVSGNLTGITGGNGDSFPAGWSADGRFALFESWASDLVAGDTNGVSDVFLADLALSTNRLISVNTNGVPGNGVSGNAVLSADGRFVAFVSAASDLVPGDTNGIADVFVRDCLAGTTTLASPGALSTNSPTPAAGSGFPQISPDGRYVAYSSQATNLVSGGQTTGDLYLYDVAAKTTTCVSPAARVAAQGYFGTTNINCYSHRFSADGRFLAYLACPLSTNALSPALLLRYGILSGATDIISTNASGVTADGGEIGSLAISADGARIAFIANTNNPAGLTTGVYLWDATSGGTILVSSNRDQTVSANTRCNAPGLDASGRFVWFLSNSTNLVVPYTTPDFHLFRWDGLSGTNQLVDTDLNGTGSAGLSPAAVVSASADGQSIAFEAPDGALVPGDNNRATDVFLRDFANQTTSLISAHDPGTPTATGNGASLLTLSCLSTSARFVAFVSEADNLVPGDTNHCRDVFVHDQLTGSNLLASIAADGVTSANAQSFEPTLSADGRYVAFTSFATNLVTGVTNDLGNVYVRDLQTGTTTLVSVNRFGTGPGNKLSRAPLLSADGNWVVFRSQAGNLHPAVSGTTENLFARNLSVGITYALTTNSAVTAVAATPDAHYVAYGAGSYVYLWNTLSAARATNFSYLGFSTTPLTGMAISPDGQHLAYSYGLQIRGSDVATGSNWVISSWTGPVNATNRPGLRFSADGRFLAYATIGAQTAGDTNGLNDVYCYDFPLHTNQLISHSFASAAPGNGPSDSPDLSPDGRFIAYRSRATNLVPGDGNNVGDLLLFDRLTGSTSAVTANPAGGATGNHWSLNASFSADSQSLVFASWASDLVPGDFNQQGDIFALTLTAPGAAVSFPLQLTSTTPPTLVWPALPGHAYTAQYRDDLPAAPWQNLNGNMTIVGNRGTAYDLAPAAARRFYRVMSN